MAKIKALIILILIMAAIAGLFLIQFFYFSPKEKAVERGVRVIFSAPKKEGTSEKLEQIQQELLASEQFKNLKKNGNWPLALEKIIKDKPLPFDKSAKF